MWVHIVPGTTLVDHLVYMQSVILHVGSYLTRHDPSRSSRIHVESDSTCGFISYRAQP